MNELSQKRNYKREDIDTLHKKLQEVEAERLDLEKTNKTIKFEIMMERKMSKQEQEGMNQKLKRKTELLKEQ